VGEVVANGVGEAVDVGDGEGEGELFRYSGTATAATSTTTTIKITAVTRIIWFFFDLYANLLLSPFYNAETKALTLS
jgi:hypothetical protein